MAKIQVKRKTLDGTITAFEFEDKCGKWLVKNFSESEIYVSTEADFVDEEAIKIPSLIGQEVITNEYLGGLDCYKVTTLYVKGTGEVEVQQLCHN